MTGFKNFTTIKLWKFLILKFLVIITIYRYIFLRYAIDNIYIKNKF